MESKILLNEEWIFDEESASIFENEFKPKENYRGNCPKCNSSDTQTYNDLFICFKCKHKIQYFNSDEEYELTEENGYLGRKNKKNYNKIEFFHRFLMMDEIKSINKKTNIPIPLLEVHHINNKKNCNYRGNLEVMDKEEHKEHHKNEYYNKAFATWSEKTYGDFTGEHEEEFNQWLEQKREDSYHGYT